MILLNAMQRINSYVEQCTCWAKTGHNLKTEEFAPLETLATNCKLRLTIYGIVIWMKVYLDQKILCQKMKEEFVESKSDS